MDMFTEALERIFRERATSAVIRRIEAGASAADLWADIAQSGYLDVLLPEEDAGAGLSLSDAFPLFMMAGQHALPVPFVQTAMARGWLHIHGHAAPEGAIAIAGPETAQSADGTLHAYGVAYGKVADWVLGDFGGTWVMLPCGPAQVQGDGTRGSQMADLQWVSLPDGAIVIAQPERVTCSVAQLAAASLAPLLAGAAHQALEMTMTHVAQREQFGRPLAKFQAVQSQISLMAERVWAMRMAAQLACHASGVIPSGRLACVAKTRCSESAVIVADGAHALHGAIGITEEYDLQLYTRRLREWRRAGGTEAWWARCLGQDVIEHSQGSALDFIVSCTKGVSA